MCLIELFFLTHTGLHDEKGKKNNMSNPLTAAHRLTGRFSPFMMMVHPYHNYPKFNYICMNCRASVKLTLYAGVIDAITDNQIMNTPHELLVHL